VVMSYPKDQILFYFTSSEPIIEGAYKTSIFDSSLLEYVDMLCEDYADGRWIPKAYSMGTSNWYYEFKAYLKFKGIDIKWK
jgi:hypothetical protein